MGPDIPKVVVFAQLTGVGSTVAQDGAQYKFFTFQYKIASIGTNVVVRAEGSNDGDDWFNLNDARVDTTELLDGTFVLHKANFKCQFVRFTIVSENGAAVTIDVTLFMGN